MMPTENIQEFRSVGALNTFFLHIVCMMAYKVAKVAGPRNHWPNQGPSNGVIIFYDAAFSAKFRSFRFVTS